MKTKVPRFIETAQRCDAAEAELRAVRREMRKLELHAARQLAKIQTSGHFFLRGCSSIAHYGEQNGFAGREAWRLAAVGRVIALDPSIEERILDGRLSIEAAVALGRVLGNSALLRDGDDWLGWAEQWSTRELEIKIRERAVEVESGEPASTMTAVLTASGQIKFDNAHRVACRKEKRALSEGQTIEILADHYLDSFDPMRREPRARQTPSTEGQPGRHIPAAVAREVHSRKRGKCSVPGCDKDIWVQKAHLVAHRFGGSREAYNILDLCWYHHWLYDLHRIRISGTADKPIFSTPDGEVIREHAVYRVTYRGPPSRPTGRSAARRRTTPRPTPTPTDR